MEDIIVPAVALALIGYLIYNCINYVATRFKNDRLKASSNRYSDGD